MPVSKINTQQEKALRCLDSAYVISIYCPLSLDGFTVKFYSSYIDRNKGELQLIGRVCVSEGETGSGISGVEIFKAMKSDNKLVGRISVGETTDGNKFITNDGFFDITVKVEKNESLFFYRTGYFVKEFTVFKLFEK
jgi:hypothetical protein